ncbi:MAG: cobalt ECF transporter T component CbiQ [Methanomicrobiales archaeon]|nr:cobalt ECF transporter T component CbiQ [Methanomicrobiales archaeon]
MIDEVFYIEKSAYCKSYIHSLDARVKIISAFSLIIVTVALPYSTAVFFVGGFFLLFLASLWALSHLSPLIFLKRLAAILPFGLCIIFFQIFLTNRYYSTFHIIAHLPFGIHIYTESIEFAGILLMKFIVCVSVIIFLSSTTKLQEMLDGAKQLGLPSDFVMALGMMVRYLFVFGYTYRKINETFKTKCFDPFDNQLSYHYRLRQIGYTIGTLFLRSYEQGERTYLAMLCRGYDRHSDIYVRQKNLSRRDWVFLILSLTFFIIIPIVVYIGGILP